MSEPYGETLPACAAEALLADQIRDIRNLFSECTPLPWILRGDAESSGLNYISGPPGTRIVANDLSFDDGFAIVTIFNHLQETLAEVERVASIAYPTFGDSSALEMVEQFLTEIARLKGDPAPVPAVDVAGDLTFMHVGCYLVFGEGPGAVHLRIASVTPVAETSLILVVDPDGNRVYLPTDLKVIVLDRDGNVVGTTSSDKSSEA